MDFSRREGAEVSPFAREPAAASCHVQDSPPRAPPELGRTEMGGGSMRPEPGKRRDFASHEPGPNPGPRNQTPPYGCGGPGLGILAHIKHAPSPPSLFFLFIRLNTERHRIGLFMTISYNVISKPSYIAIFLVVWWRWRVWL
jgi:hypothetical protein